jgi:hypothetical protein
VNRGEYWLLDSVVTLRYALDLLVAPDLTLAFNRPHHGLEYAELADTLLRLFHGGDLSAERFEDEVEFLPTRAELEAALAGTRTVYYGLTSQGGARWEAVSKPDWTRYVDAGYGLEEGEIIAREREVVAQYFGWEHYYWRNVVIPGSERWDVLEPWHATYWKTLPLGHRVRFRYLRGVTRPYEIPPPEVEVWFRDLENWYTNPFAG